LVDLFFVRQVIDFGLVMGFAARILRSLGLDMRVCGVFEEVEVNVLVPWSASWSGLKAIFRRFVLRPSDFASASGGAVAASAAASFRHG
jgi:hypothetical protein